MIRCRIDRRWGVDLVGQQTLPTTAAAAWEAMRDLPVFATHDPFHKAIHLPDGGFAPGDRVIIEHHLAGIRFDRNGRVLRYTPGVGYAFSDLSRREPGAAFPHTYEYSVTPRGDDGCRFSITVRGRWTATLVPRLIVRAWLSWVALQAIQRASNAIMLRGLKLPDTGPRTHSAS